MILTVALNPAIDNYIVATEFKPGRLNRIKKIEKAPGGKGVNIAMLLGIMGADVAAMGLVGWSASKFIQGKMTDADVITDFVLINEPTRDNFLLVDETGGEGTILDEEGPVVGEDEVKTFISTYRRMVKKARIVILAGSLPRGVGSSLYSKLAQIAHKEQVKVVINTEEENLLPVLESNPWMVMPDTRASNVIMGCTLETTRDLVDCGRQLLAKGGKNAIVTTDNKNFVLVTPENCWECITPQVEIRNILRSSDAMLAGLMYALCEGMEMKEAFRWGAALSASMLGYRGEFIKSKTEVEHYLNQVEIGEIVV